VPTILAKRPSVLSKSATLFALATALLVLASCENTYSPEWPDENRLVIALKNAPIHLDPRVGSDQSSGRAFELLYSGLVTKDTRGNLIPDLAHKWEILDDGTRYRFYLNPEVRFHDGRELGADDVVWTFGSIIDGSVSTPKRGAFSNVLEIRKIDPLTVDFILSEASGVLLPNFTSFVGIVPNRATVEEINRDPVGSGPFRLGARTADTLTFLAFDDYRLGRPPIDEVVIREVPDATVRALELRKGSVQLVINGLTPDTVPQFRDNPSYQVVESPGSNYTYIGINVEDPILSDVRVRRALALGIDRDLIISSLWRGLGLLTETMMPPGHWSRHEGLTVTPYDPAAAMAMLDEAGYPDPPGPEPRLKLTYKTSTDETRVLQAQIIQAMLAQIGVEVEIRSYEFATFYGDIKRGNFQIFSLTWSGVVDPDMLSLVLHSKNIPPAGANRGRYRNAEFDRAVDAGAERTLNEDRLPFYLRAQEIVAEELPYISLFNATNVAVASNRLVGYENYPSGELYSLSTAHLNPNANGL